MDWDGSLGYAQPWLMNGAIGLAPPRAHGVRKWLPWLTAVMLEPMVRLQEEYGSYDLRAIEASRVEHQRVKADDNPDLHANTKRVGHDNIPTWGSMLTEIDLASGLHIYAHNDTGNGSFFNDLDM